MAETVPNKKAALLSPEVRADEDGRAAADALETKKRKAENGSLQAAHVEPGRKLKRPTTKTLPLERSAEKSDNSHAAGEVAAVETPPGTSEIRARSTHELVRQHYNEKPEMGVHAREQGDLVALRKYNNFIKSILFKKFGHPESCRSRGPRILDMGCGKGGDLLKWDKAYPDLYLGVDVAQQSVQQARTRYEQLKSRTQRQRRRPWPARFYTLDCFSAPLISVIPVDLFPVDVVSMQFCLHYAFESEEKARTMLQNVSKSLTRNGVFIGTIPSSDVILSYIEKLAPGEKQIGNSAFSIRFSDDPPRNGNFQPAFGHRYTFFMKDAVEDVPEYVVPFNTLRGLADEYGLELLYRKGFHEIFNVEVNSQHGRELGLPRLGEEMKVIDRNTGERIIHGDQWETVGLYLGFAFYKR